MTNEAEKGSLPKLHDVCNRVLPLNLNLQNKIHHICDTHLLILTQMSQTFVTIRLVKNIHKICDTHNKG